MNEQGLFYPLAPTWSSRWCRKGHWAETAAGGDERIWNRNLCPSCSIRQGIEYRRAKAVDSYPRYKGAGSVSKLYRQRARAMPDTLKAARQKEHAKWSHVRKKYGLNKMDWLILYNQQGCVCAICECQIGIGEESFTDIDHDHETGKVRGILCHKCNLLMTALDNPGWLAKAQAYKERTK